ncbi:MAG TPA: glycosyltransferase family 2 protein [Candidatus Binatia bacterium]|nr:glycosyltransferase family 2 protein [Candidatus Binatia bacterium]
MRGPTAAVILHWGDVADTLACLGSVAASSLRPSPVVVVDNGSGALSAAAIEAIVPGADLVLLPENLGYAGGNNAGIRRALERGARHVVLINNDAVLEPDCLAALVAAADRAGERTGAVGAKILSAADPSRLWIAYGRLTWRAALVDRVGQGEPDGARFAGVRDADWVSGCVWLLARPALQAVGFLDDRFFAYHEDVDWCTRARRLGFAVQFAPAARAVHRGGGSLAARGASATVRYLSARNTVLFARKHARAADWLRLGVTIGASLPREWLRRRRRGDADDGLRLLVRGYVDGLLGREPPYAALGLRPGRVS